MRGAYHKKSSPKTRTKCFFSFEPFQILVKFFSSKKNVSYTKIKKKTSEIVKNLISHVLVSFNIGS